MEASSGASKAPYRVPSIQLCTLTSISLLPPLLFSAVLPSNYGQTAFLYFFLLHLKLRIKITETSHLHLFETCCRVQYCSLVWLLQNLTGGFLPVYLNPLTDWLLNVYTGWLVCCLVSYLWDWLPIWLTCYIAGFSAGQKTWFVIYLVSHSFALSAAVSHVPPLLISSSHFLFDWTDRQPTDCTAILSGNCCFNHLSNNNTTFASQF